jgi:hypothetical protein
MSISNTGGVDLESVLNVGRRTLTSIGEKALPRQQNHYTDTIHLKREDNSNSILTIDSKIFIFGELQFLYNIFERYTSNIIIREESFQPNSPSPTSSERPSFSETVEEDEEGLPIVSFLRQTSISSSKGSASPPQAPGSPSQAPGSPSRKKILSSIGRSTNVGSTVNEYVTQNLEGKRYGCIQLPNMTMIEILEILLRTGLELVGASSDYDHQNVLHQNFIFSKTRQKSQKYGQLPSRSTSFTST